MSKYEKGSLGWLIEQAKKDGFDNVRNWQNWKRDLKNKQIKRQEEQCWYNNLVERYGKEFADWAKQNKCKVENKYLMAGCKKEKEYKDKLAKNKGFKDRAEEMSEWNYRTGRQIPSSGDEYCSLYLGKHVGERLFNKFLLIIFENVEKSTRHNDGGVDFICRHPRQEFVDTHPQLKLEINKEYKVQLKTRCLIYYPGMSPRWLFAVKKTKFIYNRYIKRTNRI